LKSNGFGGNMVPQPFQFSTLEEYAIAKLISNGSELVVYPPNRYLWDMLPTIYITRHHLIQIAVKETLITAWGLDMTKYNLDTVLLKGD
jgi:hypothetical protein